MTEDALRLELKQQSLYIVMQRKQFAKMLRETHIQIALGIVYKVLIKIFVQLGVAEKIRRQ
jgi:hypothetical protein